MATTLETVRQARATERAEAGRQRREILLREIDENSEPGDAAELQRLMHEWRWTDADNDADKAALIESRRLQAIIAQRPSAKVAGQAGEDEKAELLRHNAALAAEKKAHEENVMAIVIRRELVKDAILKANEAQRDLNTHRAKFHELLVD